MAVQGCQRLRLLSSKCMAEGGESPNSGLELGKDPSEDLGLLLWTRLLRRHSM